MITYSNNTPKLLTYSHLLARNEIASVKRVKEELRINLTNAFIVPMDPVEKNMPLNLHSIFTSALSIMEAVKKIETELQYLLFLFRD